MKRILVIRGGAIGDFVLTLPAINLLRDRFPAAHLEILGYKHIVALAEKRFYADASRSIEYAALASFFARGAELPSDLADYFQSFDLVVSYLFDPDGIFETNLKRCGVDSFLACSSKITGDEHAAAQLARPLAQLDLRLSNRAAKLYPNDLDRSFAASFLQSRRPIAIHPGSGSVTKNWPGSNWRNLGQRLLSAGIADRLLLVGGEADAEVLTEIKSAFGTSVQFAENLPLPQLAAVLEKCALFLGHDSGISHIAAAVGIPCVLLFGPTDPAVWAPANEDVSVLRPRSARVADLTLESVLETAASRARN